MTIRQTRAYRDASIAVAVDTAFDALVRRQAAALSRPEPRRDSVIESSLRVLRHVLRLAYEARREQ